MGPRRRRVQPGAGRHQLSRGELECPSWGGDTPDGTPFWPLSGHVLAFPPDPEPGDGETSFGQPGMSILEGQILGRGRTGAGLPVSTGGTRSISQPWRSFTHQAGRPKPPKTPLKHFGSHHRWAITQAGMSPGAGNQLHNPTCASPPYTPKFSAPVSPMRTPLVASKDLHIHDARRWQLCRLPKEEGTDCDIPDQLPCVPGTNPPGPFFPSTLVQTHLVRGHQKGRNSPKKEQSPKHGGRQDGVDGHHEEFGWAIATWRGKHRASVSPLPSELGAEPVLATLLGLILSQKPQILPLSPCLHIIFLHMGEG